MVSGSQILGISEGMNDCNDRFGVLVDVSRISPPD
jgi:hypothetical protein